MTTYFKVIEIDENSKIIIIKCIISNTTFKFEISDKVRHLKNIKHTFVNISEIKAMMVTHIEKSCSEFDNTFQDH